MKQPYRPSDYWTSEIIMATIDEEIQAGELGGDEVGGFRIDVAKVEVY